MRVPMLSFKANYGENLEETVRELLIRVEGLEAQNERLSHANAVLNERFSHANDVFNERLSHANEAVNERLSQVNESLSLHNDEHQQTIRHLTNEMNILKQNQAATLVNSRPRALTRPEPDVRSQFTAVSCTLNVATMSCPNNRTILATSAVYGWNEACGDCCAPNPVSDCTELVEDNSPADWLAIQALCDGQTSCQFETPGTVLGDCSGQTSDYMQLFFDCLPDDETGPVAFTAWSNTGDQSYSPNDIVVFNEVLTNAGGHFNANTSSFICPWDGIYLMSVNIESFTDHIHIDLMMRNDVLLARMYLDATSGDYTRGSTTVVTECNRGDIVWVRCQSDGSIHGDEYRNMFTGHILYRYDVNTH